MSNLPAIPAVPLSDIERMGERVAKSGLFGVKTADQAVALMLVAQAEGRHPAVAAQDYDIIQGHPAKKAEAMMRDFLRGGGRIEWHALTDTAAAATFSHPQGGAVRIDWDMERAKTAGLLGKDNWRKFPRAMLRSRVVSEGIRTVFPLATSGMYVPEEVQDFDDRPRRAPLRDVTPPRTNKPADDLADFAGDTAPTGAGGPASGGACSAPAGPCWSSALEVPPHDATDKAWRTYAALLRNTAAEAPSLNWMREFEHANADGLAALQARSAIAHSAVTNAIRQRAAELDGADGGS